MHQFSTERHRFNEIRKTLLLRMLIVLPVVMLTVVIVAFSSVKQEQTNLTPLLISIAIMIVASCFSCYNVIRKQRRLFESYILKIDDQGITRYQELTPVMHISREDIRSIEQTLKGGLLIKGPGRWKNIYIPPQLENRQELEELLASFLPITPFTKKPLAGVFNILLRLAAIGSFAGVFLLDNKIAVGICGSFLVCFMAYAFVLIVIGKNIQATVKAGSVVILLLISVIVIVTYMKLTEP